MPKLKESSTLVPTPVYPPPLPDSVYPEGIVALKEHLRYGTYLLDAKDDDLATLNQWLSVLLQSNGYISLSLTELIFKMHIKTCIPSNGRFQCQFVPDYFPAKFLRDSGIDRYQGVSCKGAVKKLLDAGLLRTHSMCVNTGARKGWKKNIPGLSRKRVTGTVINNPQGLSFEELVSLASRVK